MTYTSSVCQFTRYAFIYTSTGVCLMYCCRGFFFSNDTMWLVSTINVCSRVLCRQKTCLPRALMVLSSPCYFSDSGTKLSLRQITSQFLCSPSLWRFIVLSDKRIVTKIYVVDWRLLHDYKALFVRTMIT